MAAIGVHVAIIGPKPISPLGTVIDKTTATIKTMQTTTTEMRVLEDISNAPSSVGYPTVEDYIRAEALLGYKVQILNQTYVITYAA